MGTSWKFHKGIGTIGGTVIEIVAEGYQFVFDMGRVFAPGKQLFDSVIRARDVKDLQAAGEAPKLNGLFRDGTSAGEGTVMIGISHCHLDHTGLLPYVREDIPILLTEDTHRMLCALDAVLDGPKVPLRYQPMAMGSEVAFGPLRIRAVAVDHDTPGACALFITTPDLKFVYSGDLRLHGAHAELTEEFVESARAYEPDVLFIEGTRANADNNAETFAEERIHLAVTDALKGCEAGGYFNIYPRHPERVDAFAKSAAAVQRTLVLDPATAYIYETFGGDVSSVSLWSDELVDWSPQLAAWVLRRNLPHVSASDVRGNERSYLMEMPYRRLVTLLDVQVAAGGLYFHANGTPLGPYDPSWETMQAWLAHVGLTYVNVNSTGHASRADIQWMIKEIAPRLLMPIHSVHPENIWCQGVRRLLPAYGQVYTRQDVEVAATLKM